MAGTRPGTPRPIRVAGRTGLLRPAHCTSVGKAILAGLPREHLERLYPSDSLPGLTERSITSRDRLFAALEAASGGSDDIHAVRSKSATAKDAALVLQDGFSTRALLGLPLDTPD